jgi:hypothetical protein
MTKRLNRNDSHVKAFRDFQAGQEAQEAAAQERAANLPFSFDLKSSDFYATIFDSAHDAARPVGTITRPRMFGEARAKLWTVAATDGVNVYQSALRPSAMQATRALIRHAAKVEAEQEEARRAADLARLVASAKEAQAIAAEVDSALAALDAAQAPAIESGEVGADWKPAKPAESFYAQAPALPNARPGPFAFGPSEEAARKTLAELLAEDVTAKQAERAARKSLAELLAPVTLARRDSGACQLIAPGGAWIGPGPLFPSEGAARAWAALNSYPVQV